MQRKLLDPKGALTEILGAAVQMPFNLTTFSANTKQHTHAHTLPHKSMVDFVPVRTVVWGAFALGMAKPLNVVCKVDLT